MPETTIWHHTACILCSVNCGIEVRLDGRRLAGIRGDKAHPGSRGYACEDWLAGTPWHKHVPARIEAVAATAEAS
jgi:anaerobic selenocysteine-containing dehydrogenase